MDAETRRELRDYAWKYFALHAEQRLRTFNFFLALIAVLSGGLFAILKDGDSPAWGMPIAGAIAFSAVIFWRIDERNHDLLSGSEAALKVLEAEMAELPDDGETPNQLKLFLREKYETHCREDKARLLLPYLTYKNSFRIVFGSVLALALVLGGALVVAVLH